MQKGNSVQKTGTKNKHQNEKTTEDTKDYDFKIIGKDLNDDILEYMLQQSIRT